MTSRLYVGVTALLVAVGPTACRDGRAPQPRAVVAGEPAGALGIAHLDPKTRRFVEPPPGAVPSVVRSGRAAALAALREENGPRGGKMVHLGDLFRHNVVASTEPSGAVTRACSPGAVDADRR